MKRLAMTASMLVLTGVLSGSVLAAQDGFVVKDEAGDSYCHLKFPAIREDTLDWKTPVLKDPSTGDLTDFYGPCDESPTGADQVLEQKNDTSFRLLGREIED